MPFQIDPVLISRQHVRAARHCGPTDGRIVVKDRAEADHAVRPVENLACAGSADLAPVDAGELGVILRKEALRRGHDGDGTAERFGAAQIACFSAPAAAARPPDEQDRFLLALQKFPSCRNGGTQGLGVAWLFAKDCARPGRAPHKARCNVACDLDIGRLLLLAQRVADRVVDLMGCVGRGIDGDCRTSELLGDFQLVRPIVRRERVVNQMLCRAVVAVGRAGYQDNR